MIMMAGKPEKKPEPSVKLDMLMVEFRPNRMTLHIELVPPGKGIFDCPLKEPGKKLNMIANYARTVFEVEMRKKLKDIRRERRGR